MVPEFDLQISSLVTPTRSRAGSEILKVKASERTCRLYLLIMSWAGVTADHVRNRQEKN